jgi:uncharacterized protein YbjT (DUF2867 family)
MSEKKIIAVLGATGAQGGGLVRAIAANPQIGFTARAVTRNPNSDKAKALADLGAEVVQGDVDDRASLKSAFTGAYGAFGVTFFWDHFSAEKEVAQAHVMADVAKETGIQHFVWSTLEDTRKFVPLDDDRMPTLHGKYKVPHFDGKGEADKYFMKIGLPTTLFRTSFYYENFIYFGMAPQKGQDGNLALMLPLGEKKLPAISAEDIGKCAFGVYQRPELIGKTVSVAGDHVTGAEFAAEFSKLYGTQVPYFAVPFDVFRGLGFPGADDLGNMFQFKHDFQEQFVGARDLEFSRKLNPELQSFSQWMKENGDKIPRNA